MKIEYEHSDNPHWPSRLECEDDYGNSGTVQFPHLSTYRGWRDADVNVSRTYTETLDGERRQIEFHLELIRIAEVLDLAFQGDSREHKEREAKERAEQEEADRKHQEAVNKRAEQLGQYYMQTCRVQRKGHRSHATGELVVRYDEETETFNRYMWLNENNGDTWDFYADDIARFEVKDGGRYKKIKLTPIPER